MNSSTFSRSEITYKDQMKILVIEDDREAAEYLEKALTEAGHTAHVAGDGETGFNLADSGDYDALITSVREFIFTLPPDTAVYSGHGPATTVGDEMRHNPFFSEFAR